MRRWIAVASAVAMFMAMGGIAVADEPEVEDSKEEIEASDVQVLRAWRLAEYFEQDPETLLELREGEESSIGWGALYKLLLLADASGADINAYLDSGDFSEGWGFGKLFKELVESDPEALDDAPKNFGQWKKQQREADGWQPPGQAKKNG